MPVLSSVEGPTSAPRTLADQVRSWSDEQLAALLRTRPDLGVPAPTDSAQLAARATTRTSVLRALDRLDRTELAVLEAIASIGPVSAQQLHEIVYADELSPALATLCEQLLVWDDGRGLRSVAMVGELVGVPAGPAADSVEQLLAELGDLEPGVRGLLDRLDREESDAAGSVSGVPTRASARTPVEHLAARGLLVARDGRRMTIPWSVRLALRAGRSTHAAVDVAPVLAVHQHDPALVDRTAAGTALEAVRRVELLLEQWGLQPPGVLRSGGLGVRDLRAAAELLDVPVAEAALLIETSAAAGLLAVGSTPRLDAAWLPTSAYDAWQAKEPAGRWAALARAWLSTVRDIARVGGRLGTKPVNALDADLERGWLPGLRHDTLAVLAELPNGSGLVAADGLDTLLGRLRWRRPRRPASQLDAVPGLLDQAEILGVTARAALSGPGRALLEDTDPAVVLAGLLPDPIDHVLVQADLTAVAPGPLVPDLSWRLGLLADVESSGGGTVYRFSAASVRRAFDGGWSATEVHDFLGRVSRTPVPQSLSYLVDDVSRRFGVLRVGRSECFLRSDDEPALSELVRHPQAESLGLRRIAPTVVVCNVSVETLLPRLRSIGLAPVVEALDGTVHVGRPERHRAPAPRRPNHQHRSGAGGARPAARAAAVVAAIRAGDRAARTRPARGPVSSPADVVTLLRACAEAGAAVLIGYAGADGTVTERVVTPQRVDGGRLTAYDERADTDREFALHRITGAVRA